MLIPNTFADMVRHFNIAVSDMAIPMKYKVELLGMVSAMEYRHEQDMPKWIPCSERLPKDVGIGEEYPTVIFCTKDAVYAGFHSYDCDGDGYWWVCDGSEYITENVIAWMELPKPWEGDTDGKER